jgi:hypothetical protein
MADERSGVDTAGYLGWFFFSARWRARRPRSSWPKSGRETRELLAEQSGDVLSRAKVTRRRARIKGGRPPGEGARVSRGAVQPAHLRVRGRPCGDARRDVAGAARHLAVGSH